ncbi:hypothetical protein DE146DRAFT_59838 [Phaeosphaeria sp. MPI-PUGE-AT-0046c]|nr:hypothetical protein DE146DRAFT_59838 [Phaeosphaeria sp. MPI-PUGE-AT-0046c]
MSQLNQTQLPWSTLLEYPAEIRLCVLSHFVGPQLLEVEETTLYEQVQSSTSTVARQQLQIKYTCTTDAAVDDLPEHLQPRYWDIRGLSWLRSPKYFMSLYHFAMAHRLLAASSQAALPAIDNQPVDPESPESEDDMGEDPIVSIDPLIYTTNHNYPFHGLEKIVLDFDAEQYFDFFNVCIPPFDHPENQGSDPRLRGAASLLQHCHELTILFGEKFCYVHPWYSLRCDEWQDARIRSNVCEKGRVVDWILEYAWHLGYLQHIKTIKIAGSVQEWVRKKWDDVFEKWKEAQQNGKLEWKDVHRPNITHMETFGLVSGREWALQDFYPPVCSCDLSCSSLVPWAPMCGPAWNSWDEIPEEEGDPSTWDDGALGEDDAVIW